DAEPRDARRLLTRLEQSLKPQANPEVGGPGADLLQDHLVHTPAQGLDAVPEAALTRDDQLVGLRQALWVGAALDANGGSELPTRELQGFFDAAQVGVARVDD